MSERKDQKPVGILSVIQSVLSAMIGVQSEAKRKRDFEGGDAGSYVFVGIVMVLIFIFSLIAIVDSILESAGQK